MKEMVGGCCVCSDERGWQENPLVYCDGHDCTVAVHQACYGIDCVPTGPWFCERCASGEPPSKLRCDLCPMREGALKRTDKNGWAHVVCALYIPEIQFGNVRTMDPIMLSMMPPERFNKVCYICEEKGSIEKAQVGACMQCNKSGCKASFHVTCGQQEGLLCEESGNMDNIKYCGYCSFHFRKLRKGDPSIKAIPPYRPIIPSSASSTNSTNKEKNAAVNNSRSPIAMGGNSHHPSVRDNNGNTNTNHNSMTNRPDNCIKVPTATRSDGAASCVNTDSATSSSINAAISVSSSSTVVAGSNHVKPSVSMGPGQRYPPVVVPADRASSAWTKPVPHISYLGFNNDILHTSSSASSGHLVNVTSVSATAPLLPPPPPPPAPAPTSLTALASVTPVSSVLPPGGFASNTSTPNANTLYPNTGPKAASTVPAPVPGPPPASASTSAPAPVAVAASGAVRSSKSAGVNSGHKRKSDGKEQSGGTGGSAEEKAKRPRRSSKKTVKTLLQLVSPVVEDTVSSFQREKVANQRSEMVQQQQQQQQQQLQVTQLQQQQQQQQQLLHQHQQSSIDSVIAATASGQQSSHCSVIGISERAAVPSAPTRPPAPEAAEQPSSAVPVIGPPPPVRLTVSRGIQEAPSLAGPPTFPTSLEQLLERQWEQGSQFLMEQAQHFDIASLLSCLHQLKIENQRLEDHLVSLAGRRDHLLAVNARLSLSLGQQQHPSPNSPRINAAASATTPFHHLHPQCSQDSSHDTSENSISSRLSVPPNTSTPIALHHPLAGPALVPLVTASKPIQPPTTASSTVVVSPPNKPTFGSLGPPPSAAAAPSSNFTLVPGTSSALPGGVYSTVKEKSTQQEPSPDRQQQTTPGSFLVPRAPTPMLATDLVRTPSSLVSNQYAVAQDPHHRMFYQFMQQNAFAAAAYGNAFSNLMQSTSPHRAAAAAVLAQSHLGPHTGTIPPPASTQEKS